MAIIIGMEPANSNVKVVSNVLKKVDMYLNTTTLMDSYGNGDGIGAPGTYKVKLRDGGHETFKVGEFQKDKEETKSSSGGEDRYETEEFQIESTIAIFRELERIQKETSRDAFNGEEIYVVTGVPTGHSASPKTVSDIEASIEGEHEVNGKKFTVKKVYVLKQGLSAFYHLTLDEDGEPKASFYKDIMELDLLIIDIGHGTTDLQWIKGGVPHSSAETRGFSTVYASIMNDIVGGKYENFNNLYKTSLTPLSIAPEMEKGDMINITGERINVKDEKDRYYLRYAKNIIASINRNGFKDHIFNRILFVGGGSVGLKSYLERAINEKYAGKPAQIERFRLDEIIEDAQKYNALGYMKYGMFVLNSQGVEV